MEMNTLPPAFILIAGAALVPFFRGHVRNAWILALPLLSFLNLLHLPEGQSWILPFLGQELVFCRVDALSLLFGYIFLFITFTASLYGLNINTAARHMVTLIYAGATQGVLFAGDLLTLFLFWEMLTVCAALIIWSNRTARSLTAGFHYFLMHAAGGLCFLAGIILHSHETGCLAFDTIGLSTTGSWLIFLGAGVNCAWPPFHCWLTDAYPEASPVGTVALSAFTTKSAVYFFVRAFPGAEPLIWIGVVMITLPSLYAIIENNLRRLLSYSLINQVGFMMIGIGIGTPMAINGAVCHAFCHILYKGLLFMAMGAVLYRTGKINCTDLGAIYKSMPWTAVCGLIGAAAIPCVPFFAGFVSKSMIVQAAGAAHMPFLWLTLVFAATGVIYHTGIKAPYYAFFSRDTGIRCEEAPVFMRWAMGLMAAGCILAGVFPAPLYALLPYPVVDFHPYTPSHILIQVQMLLAALLVFFFLMRFGLAGETKAENRDVDYLYRPVMARTARLLAQVLNTINRRAGRVFAGFVPAMFTSVFRDLPGTILRGAAAFASAELEERISRCLQAGFFPMGLAIAMAAMILFAVAAAFLTA